MNFTLEEPLKMFLDGFCLSEDIIGKDLLFYQDDKLIEKSNKLKIKDYKNFSGIIKVVDNNGILSDIRNIIFYGENYKIVIHSFSGSLIKDLIFKFLKICSGKENDHDISNEFCFLHDNTKLDPHSDKTLKSLLGSFSYSINIHAIWHSNLC